MDASGRLPSEVLAEQMKQLRQGRGLSAKAVADQVQRMGGKLDRAAIAKIEVGRRGVSLDEALLLAAALNVSPTTLVTPPDDRELVQVAPEVATQAVWVRDWFHGVHPVPPEADLDEFIATAPAGVRRRNRIYQHPAVAALDSLRVFAEEAVDRSHPGSNPNPREHPREHAQAIRREAERVSAYMALLADELEREADDKEGE